jgi:hypothetical protein
MTCWRLNCFFFTATTSAMTPINVVFLHDQRLLTIDLDLNATIAEQHAVADVNV